MGAALNAEKMRPALIQRLTPVLGLLLLHLASFASSRLQPAANQTNHHHHHHHYNTYQHHQHFQQKLGPLQQLQQQLDGPQQHQQTSTRTSLAATTIASTLSPSPSQANQTIHHFANQTQNQEGPMSCSTGLLTFELSTGFIYKPSSAETLAMMPSTLQLTDCLDFCLQNSSCLAVNFEMGLCVLLSSSAKQNPTSLFSSQFPVFTIYAEKKCLLQGEPAAAKQRLRCRRAWTFERAAGYEMRSRPRRRLRLASREQCMEACLGALDFECRSANWYRQTGECTLSDQDRHSVAQAEAGDQQLQAGHLYGPTNLTLPASQARQPARPTPPPGLYQNYYWGSGSLSDRLRASTSGSDLAEQQNSSGSYLSSRSQQPELEELPLPANAPVDYLENNCVFEPNKLCEFRKIQNRVLKTVDSIYQEVASLEECKQRCLNAPYRCYSFDYGDTAERVCRTSHLDQASLVGVKDPYLEVAGAITYELASCFSVHVQCGGREMVAQVRASKSFRGRIYAKSRPLSCVNDVREALQFELSMRYHEPDCDVRASSQGDRGVFSADIVIQHHDRIVTTQDVGLSVYCQYDLGNRSISNNVDLAIDRLDPLEEPGGIESKNRPVQGGGSGHHPALSITSLATTVVRSPNVTMRITNMLGQPVASATVGDRLALLFEIKEKTSPFGIFVREIIAMDGRQILAAASKNNNGNNANNGPKRGYHYATNASAAALQQQPQQPQQPLDEAQVESLFQANRQNSVQFIDQDGCPTDANLMGPLVKMDPAGHRVLAPFDAFKFPSSDMVFFRAVVTSCVSECRPAICPSATGAALPPASLSSLSSSNPQEQELLYTTSTTLAASTSASSPPSVDLARATETTPAPTTTTVSHLRASPGPAAVVTSAGGGDATTTVANLGPTREDPAHIRQKPPGEPALVAGSLGALTLAQRQQVLKLFGQRLEQQLQAVAASINSTSASLQSLNSQQQPPIQGDQLSSFARLYANILAGLMLKGDDQPAEASGHQLAWREWLGGAGGSHLEATNAQARQQTPPPESFYEQALGEQRSAQMIELVRTTMAAALEEARQGWRSKSSKDQDQEAASNNRSEVELVKATNVQGHQDFEAHSAKLLTQTEATTTTTTTSTTQAPTMRYRSQQKPNSKPSTGGNQQEQRRKASLQALADAYLGAYQSFGRRRRRRSASAEEEISQPSYLLLRQQQAGAQVEPASLRHHPEGSRGGGGHFTEALVELYHQPKRQSGRKKREAQPSYDMDELVVQSIKIVDRLQFKRGEEEEASTASLRRLDEDPSDSSPSLGAAGQRRLLSWTSPSALGLLLLVASFLLLQLLLALVCLVDWRQRQARQRRHQQQQQMEHSRRQWLHRAARDKVHHAHQLAAGCPPPPPPALNHHLM